MKLDNNADEVLVTAFLCPNTMGSPRLHTDKYSLKSSLFFPFI